MNWTAWIANTLVNLKAGGSFAGAVVSGSVNESLLYEYAVELALLVNGENKSAETLDDKEKITQFILDTDMNKLKSEIYIVNGNIVDGRFCCEDCNISAMKAMMKSGKTFILYHSGEDFTKESILWYCQVHVFLSKEVNDIMGNLKVRVRKGDEITFESPEVVTMRGNQFVPAWKTSVRFTVNKRSDTP